MNTSKIFIILGIAIAVLGASFYLMREDAPRASVNSFEDCAAAGYPVGESHPRQCWTPEGQHFVEEIEEVEPNEPALPNEVTLRGTIACLPKIGTGPQTLECAIGLKAEDGKYYGLKNLFEHDPQYQFSATNKAVEVSGTLNQEEMRGPDGNRYNVAGVISVSSIKEQ